MKRQYRIESWRHDVPLSTLETPTFEAETEELCDALAITHMNQLSEQTANSWNGLRVFRIDAPAVEEKRTFLAHNGRQR